MLIVAFELSMCAFAQALQVFFNRTRPSRCGLRSDVPRFIVNSRSIPQELWEEARQAIVAYFSVRHGWSQAEDLAQDTLATIWAREDFLFESEDQFLRVCYGFASRILLQAYRQTRKHTGQPLDPAAPSHDAAASGLIGMEVAVFVEEVGRAARCSLTETEWELVQSLAEGDRAELSAGFDAGEANRFRVRLCRIRQKLTKLTGGLR